MSISDRSVTALLFIKEHSERVPNKNFRLLGGRPLFHWMVETLRAVALIDRIVVNTDAPDRLIELGLIPDERLIVKRRSAALLGDRVSANELIAHALQGEAADLFLMTHATSPFLKPETLRQAVIRLDSDGAGSLFGVTPLQSRLYDAAGLPLNHNPSELLPTQDLKPVYLDNSTLYVFTRSSFGDLNNRVGADAILFETPLNESLDIDTEADWRLAEVVAAGLGQQGGDRE